MEIRRAYHRRSIKQARLQKRLAVAAMLAVAACTAFVLQPGQEHPEPVLQAAAAPAARMQAAPAVLRIAAQASPSLPRRVYPYSIVPGGVTSRAELAYAVMADKVVAAHYAGFAVDKASVRTVAGARAVYVSYRKGDQVYWTARKVMLADGETVVSDGQSEIRGRCGNRISDTPRLPVEVKGPDERELDTPVDSAAGTLRETAFTLDDEAGDGQPFRFASYTSSANSAAQVSASQAYASQDQASFVNLLDDATRRALLATLASPVSRLASRTTSSTVSGTTNTSTAETGGTADTGASDTGGTGTSGDAGGASTGDKPAGGGTGTGTDTNTGTDPGVNKPTVPGLNTDPLPNGAVPPKSHDVPEPDSLWLMGVAALALLLQRRLRSRRPR
jgi:hypothetical protein